MIAGELIRRVRRLERRSYKGREAKFHGTKLFRAVAAESIRVGLGSWTRSFNGGMEPSLR